MTGEPNSKSSEKREIQEDSLFDGGLVCRQYKEGYRFSIDSVLLAHYPAVKKDERILDLGAGTGILGLILCYRCNHLNISVTGIELQKDLAGLARENIELNAFSRCFSIIEADIGTIRSLLAPESCSLVISNPPFYSAGSGRRNFHPEALTARHQAASGLTPFVDAASFTLQNRGRAVFIYPADKVVQLLTSLTEKRLNPKAIQFIYSYPEADSATLAIIQAVKNGGRGTKIEQPLIIFQRRGGDYTEAVSSMFANR